MLITHLDKTYARREIYENLKFFYQKIEFKFLEKYLGSETFVEEVFSSEWKT